MAGDQDQRLDAAERRRRAELAAAGHARLAEAGVVGVATSFVDASGLVRTKAVPLAGLADLAAWGVGASTVFDVFLTDDSATSSAYAGGPVGDLRLVPDLERLVVLAAQPGWAWAPADRYRQDGTAHSQDARLLLRRTVDALAARGLTARTAIEVEWCVGRDTDDGSFVPVGRGPAYGLARLVEVADYARDVLSALADEGVRVQQIHPEYAAGQFELSVAAEEPVSTADTTVLLRETVRAVSGQHRLRASFSPKVLADGVGNGGHVHVSCWRDGANAMAGGSGPHGLTATGEAFTAGVLDHLPGLLAIGAPSPASYLRLVPSHWSAPWLAWGLENREAAVRMVTGPAGSEASAANVEVKCVDLGANPYLLLAGVLAAGLSGVEAGARLPEPVDVDPAVLPAEERERRGIVALPGDLAAATDAFEADAVLQAAYGPALAATVVALRRAEVARFAGASPEEVCAALRWTW